MAKLNWKRSKLNNPEWIEGIAPCAVGGEYRIRGTGNEYVVGYRRPRERRHSSVKIGTAANVPDAMALAQADNDQRVSKILPTELPTGQKQYDQAKVKACEIK